ncbi:MAG: hypothetical protein WC881_00290 [Elusimicrobiota bacterium]|jgi:protein arginine kinase activator
MICTACQKAEAVVFIKHIINNQVSQAALCSGCAAHAHIPIDPVNPFHALMDMLGKPAAPRPRAAAARCPGCSTTWAEFRSTGRFGCARCYEHFADHIRTLLPGIHAGAYAHRGKSPKRRPLNG